ncbi:hypothetical protein [Stenotrophomonas sp. S39]|uniref:hypothetical protein n=1 Tax=Stenotrophomonas sp. S39 TaxID=2767451 RepID=UPI00190DFAA1|nr:hypothetical protein [Stenotrophomonas sp. S39]MBK0052993.1 hypothetical protein [Stenotrophomonas sp. S39]
MYDDEINYDESEGELLSVIAFSPAMSFDEDIEDELVIEQLSVVCRAEYIDADGDECIAWFDAVLDHRGLNFDEPESLKCGGTTTDNMYECVSDAFSEAIDSCVYDLGDAVDHMHIPVTSRDAELIFEMVDSQFVHEIDDAHYVCCDRYLDPNDLGGRHLNTPAPYYAIERNTDLFIPLHSPADFLQLDEEFQRARIQNHINVGQEELIEVQRSVQVRRM